jgi:uncharacterized membrane protein
MKKRIFEKIFNIVAIILALTFIAVLLTTIFGGIDYQEFDNSLVKSLFIGLAIIYLVISIISLINLFSDNDIVKDIAVSRDRTGSTKATASIIKKLTKKYIKTIEGVTCNKVTLLLTEYGVNLRISIKIRDAEIKETTTYIKMLLDNVFEKTLDYKFHSIDFKVQKLQSNYEPPVEELHIEADNEVLMEKTLKLKKEAEERAKAKEFNDKIKEAVDQKELENASEKVEEEATDVTETDGAIIDTDVKAEVKTEVAETTEEESASIDIEEDVESLEDSKTIEVEVSKDTKKDIKDNKTTKK